MSIDRCADARKLVEAQFTLADEAVTGDELEKSGIYTVRGRAPTHERAVEIAQSVEAAFAAEGTSVSSGIADAGDAGVTLEFRIDVGGIRGTL